MEDMSSLVWFSLSGFKTGDLTWINWIQVQEKDDLMTELNTSL